MCGRFFIQAGIRASDAPSLRRLCIQLSAAGYGDMGYFMGLPVEELSAVADEVGRIMKGRRNKRQ